jgi:type II secretory pathway pseudopilin PulG
MNLAIALYLAAAVAPPMPAQVAEQRLGGAQADARVAVEILRTAVLRDGRIVFSDGREGPRTQQVRRDGRITYEFE